MVGGSIRGDAADPDLSVRLHHDHDQQAQQQEEQAQKD
jgi:hypothetical protein